MDKPSKRRLTKDTLSSKEDMESELNKKLPKPSSWVPVQPAPLTQSEDFAPVRVLDVSATTFDRMSNLEASSGFYPDEGYNYGDRYRGFQATRYNSSQVNDEEADARPDFRYHRYRQPAQAPGYVGAYSAPFIDPNARGRGLPASHDEPQRESHAPQALNRIERIKELMEHQQAAATSASSASSAQLQAFIGQGEFIFSYFFEILKNYSFSLYSFPWSPKGAILSTLHCGNKLGGRRLTRRPVPNGLGLRSEVRVSGTKMCGSKHCLVLT
jgi:hypothetical protein